MSGDRSSFDRIKGARKKMRGRPSAEMVERRSLEVALEDALARTADHLRGEGSGRNKAWRIAEMERRMFGDEADQW